MTRGNIGSSSSDSQEDIFEAHEKYFQIVAIGVERIRMQAKIDELLTADETARRIGVTRRALDMWHKNGAPAPEKIYLDARTPRYRAAEVSAWIAKHGQRQAA